MRKKGRSSTGGVIRRKNQVAHEDKRVSSSQCCSDAVHPSVHSQLLAEYSYLFMSASTQEIIITTLKEKAESAKERKKNNNGQTSAVRSALDRFKKRAAP